VRECHRPQAPCGWWRSPDEHRGKTVSLKSVGLAALMARAGLFSCAVRHGCPGAPVLTDIGDEQSRCKQKPLTFMAIAPHRPIPGRPLPRAALRSQQQAPSLVLLE